MNFKFLGSVLPLFALEAPVAAETRTFPDAECAYTLPNKDWEWLDPSLRQLDWGKTLVFARNQRGVLFTLRVRSLTPLDVLSSHSYEDFEKDMLSDGKLTRMAGKHVLFNGIPSYQFDVHSTSGVQFRRIRIMYANDRFYYLQVSSDAALDADPDVQLAILKFELTGTARAMLPTGDPKGDGKEAKEERAGWGISRTLFVVVTGIGLIVGIWWIFHSRENA
jgi:hypothetical protein